MNDDKACGNITYDDNINNNDTESDSSQCVNQMNPDILDAMIKIDGDSFDEDFIDDYYTISGINERVKQNENVKQKNYDKKFKMDNKNSKSKNKVNTVNMANTLNKKIQRPQLYKSEKETINTDYNETTEAYKIYKNDDFNKETYHKQNKQNKQNKQHKYDIQYEHDKQHKNDIQYEHDKQHKNDIQYEHDKQHKNDIQYEHDKQHKNDIQYEHDKQHKNKHTHKYIEYIKNKNANNTNIINDDEVTTITEYTDIDVDMDSENDITSCECDECMGKQKHYMKIDDESIAEILVRDEIKLSKIHEKLEAKADMQHHDNTINFDNYIFDKHMEIVCQNITNIKNYLDMCNIHLDTYITILKQAYQCLSDICNPCNNYMVYNAARIKLCNLLREADTIIKNAYYKELPIFYNSHRDDKGNLVRCPTSIKFPLFICTDTSMNNILAHHIGSECAYFKIQLMKVSLKHIKLEKYCKSPLSKGEKVSNNTSPIPPCNCPIGNIPDCNMYIDSDLRKCWDMNYHLNLFENALYRVTMAKEILCTYSNLIEIKEELCYKIKVANLKDR